MRRHSRWCNIKTRHYSFRESKELRKRAEVHGTNWNLLTHLWTLMFLILRTLAHLWITVSLISVQKFSNCILLGSYNSRIPYHWVPITWSPQVVCCGHPVLVQESPMEYFQELVVKHLVAWNWSRWEYLFIQQKPANVTSPPSPAGCSKFTSTPLSPPLQLHPL